MNVASLNLCRELWELSGWESDIHWISQGPNEYLAPRSNYPTVAVHDDALGEYPYFDKKVCPAYTLDYLLRKLPSYIETNSVGCALILQACIKSVNLGKWSIGYEMSGIGNISDTPKNAACRLAIELFKEGILKKEEV